MNFLAILVSALVPTFIGLIWYHPSVFGKAWQKGVGLSDEQIKNGKRMALVLVLSFVFSVMLSMGVMPSVIHQFGIVGVLGGDVATASEAGKMFMLEHEHSFRTFKHGALHGIILGIFFVFPILAINALFERKSWSYIFINAGYWTLSFAIMGAILSGWESERFFQIP